MGGPYLGKPVVSGDLVGSLLLSRVTSASIFCLKASYSGVPGRGGKSFGGPPSHVGMLSDTWPAHAARAVATITNAIKRAMTEQIACQADQSPGLIPTPSFRLSV